MSLLTDEIPDSIDMVTGTDSDTPVNDSIDMDVYEEVRTIYESPEIDENEEVITVPESQNIAVAGIGLDVNNFTSPVIEEHNPESYTTLADIDPEVIVNQSTTNDAQDEVVNSPD